MGEDGAITTYAAPQPSWESWFETYRFGALYVFPPPDLRARVNALRHHYDARSQAICDAHISLTVPLPAPLTLTAAAELHDVIGATPPFIVQWGPPYQYPGIPGVVLRIQPIEPFAALVRALESCACFAHAAPRPHPFSPHMTIAEFIMGPRSREILAELGGLDLDGEFPCTEVAYAVPDATFRFTERAVWRTGTSAAQGL